MTLNPEIIMFLLTGIIFLVVILVIFVVRIAIRSSYSTDPLIKQMESISERVQLIGDGQQQLAGGLTHVSESQAAQQSNMIKLMEARLAAVQEQMSLNLNSSAKNTAKSLGELQQRLVTIDTVSYTHLRAHET